MSSIRANITNIYQSGERITRQVGLQPEPEDETTSPAGVSGIRRDQPAPTSPKQGREDPNAQLELPTDPNGVAQKVVYTEPNRTESGESPLPSPAYPKTNQPVSEAQTAFHQAQQSESDLQKSRREKILQQEDVAADLARSEADKRRETTLQPKPVSVLEQFMLKLREQSKARRNEENQKRLNDEDRQGPSESSSLAAADRAGHQDLKDSRAATETTADRNDIRQQEDQDMYRIRRRIHEDFYSNPQFHTGGNVKSPDISIGGTAAESSAPQEPIAQKPVFEAFAQPFPIDLDEYVKKLRLALIPEIPPELANDQDEAGSKMLEHLQSEGVFGLSPHGRYQSVNDFIRTKEFEFEMEQRPFTEDDFLLQTETAIYEVLRRGNTSSLARPLLQAAEAVNSFRNHLIRSSGEDLSAAPAVYSNSPLSTPEEAASADNTQK